LKPVQLTPAAKSDIADASRWYESRREGLGDEFLDRVDEAIGEIARAPEGFQKVYKQARRVTLEQFRDHALWYVVRPDRSLVIGCLSGKRAALRLLLGSPRAYPARDFKAACLCGKYSIKFFIGQSLGIPRLHAGRIEKSRIECDAAKRLRCVLDLKPITFPDIPRQTVSRTVC
jgi:toxin ParE1/3/4